MDQHRSPAATQRQTQPQASYDPAPAHLCALCCHKYVTKLALHGCTISQHSYNNMQMPHSMINCTFVAANMSLQMCLMVAPSASKHTPRPTFPPTHPSTHPHTIYRCTAHLCVLCCRKDVIKLALDGCTISQGPQGLLLMYKDHVVQHSLQHQLVQGLGIADVNI